MQNAVHVNGIHTSSNFVACLRIKPAERRHCFARRVALPSNRLTAAYSRTPDTMLNTVLHTQHLPRSHAAALALGFLLRPSTGDC